MDTPSGSGEITIALNLPPVSQQARGESKNAFQAAVRDITAHYAFFLSGDVSVAVEWSVAERTRYETDRSPDVDNILKPLLDALTGPSGVLIDDNQVQHVSCHWIDSHTDAESLTITLRHSPDEWLRKPGLYFVQLQEGLCVPLSHQTPRAFQRTVIEVYQRALKVRDEALAKGIDYFTAKSCMPIQRMFHRTRLGAFEVITLEMFVEQSTA